MFTVIVNDPSSVIIGFLSFMLSIAGGVALVMIMLAGYKLMTSKGNPEAVQQGREQITSAIVGLIFIIFSFVIYQLIVVNILHIPGVK